MAHEIPYVDEEIIDSTTGQWYAVYDQSEGFQPRVYLIKSDNPSAAEEVWIEQERNDGRSVEQLVVIEQAAYRSPSDFPTRLQH